MSQLLQGKMFVQSVSSGEPPELFWNGIPLNADHTMAYDSEGAIAFYHQGLPFTAQSRIAASIVSTPVRFNNGAMPLDAAGRLSMDVGAGGPVVAALAANGYVASGNIRLGKVI